MEEWKERLDCGEIVAMVAMDLSKAFDSLPHALLVAKLQAYGLDDSGCALMQDYLSSRCQRVKVGDAFSGWEYNGRGVPQGSVLGPLFFNIFINDIFLFISISLNAYADDQQLYSSDLDHELLYNRINNELSIAVDWFKHNGLMANPDKFHALILGSTDLDFNFNVGGFEIERLNDVDLLGINIDCNLKFHKHIVNVCEKVNKQLQVLRRFRNLVSTDVKKTVYIRHLYYPTFYIVATCGTFAVLEIVTNLNS